MHNVNIFFCLKNPKKTLFLHCGKFGKWQIDKMEKTTIIFIPKDKDA